MKILSFCCCAKLLTNANCLSGLNVKSRIWVFESLFTFPSISIELLPTIIPASISLLILSDKLSIEAFNLSPNEISSKLRFLNLVVILLANLFKLAPILLSIRPYIAFKFKLLKEGN